MPYSRLLLIHPVGRILSYVPYVQNCHFDCKIIQCYTMMLVFSLKQFNFTFCNTFPSLLLVFSIVSSHLYLNLYLRISVRNGFPRLSSSSDQCPLIFPPLSPIVPSADSHRWDPLTPKPATGIKKIEFHAFKKTQFGKQQSCFSANELQEPSYL